MYADILIEINSLEKTFTYKVPNGINAVAGERVLVPFGGRKLEGFIVRVYKESNYDYEVKDIICLIDDHPVINKEMMELGKYISQKNLSSLISAYQTMLPRALKAKNKSNINKKYLTFLKCVSSDNIKTEKQKDVYNYIYKKGEVLKELIKKELGHKPR